MGYFGYKDTAGLNWADFMDTNGVPTGVSEDVSWPDWGGSQPGIWNPHGQLERNLGSFGDFTKNGKLLMSNEGFSIGVGWDVPVFLPFTPVVWDDSLSSSESHTYTRQRGYSWKFGSLVWFSVDITINSLCTLTTTDIARIANLPYTASSLTNANFPCTVGFADSLAITAGNAVSGYVGAGLSRIALTKWSATTGTSFLTIGELSSGGRLIISGQYFV